MMILQASARDFPKFVTDKDGSIFEINGLSFRETSDENNAWHSFTRDEISRIFAPYEFDADKHYFLKSLHPMLSTNKELADFRLQRVFDVRASHNEYFRKEFAAHSRRQESRKQGVDPWMLSSSETVARGMSSAGYRL